MNGVFLAWLVEVGFIGVRELRNNKRLPLPSQLLASALVFGGLSMLSESETWNTTATVTAWGIVLGTVVGAGSDKPALLKTTSDFLTGASGPTGAAQLSPPISTGPGVPIIGGGTYSAQPTLHA